MEIFGILRTTFKEPPDPYMYTSALVACENGKQAKLALSLLDSMVADGHGLNTYSVTTAIAACAASGRTDDALGLLTMMREKKIPCSVWTFNAAIFACANAGRWRDALTVFEIMRAYSEKEEAYLEVSTPPADASSKEDALHSRKRKSEAVLNSLEGDEVEEEDLFSMTEEDTLRVMQTTVLDLTPDLVLLSQDDGLNSVDSAKIPLNINCSKNHTSSGLERMSYMEEENFLGSFQFANIVTVNTLIEALGEGEQFTLVDEVYLDAVKRNIISPLVKFEEGLVDLHFHSVHMANAALRYVFEVMLADDTALNAQGEVSKDIVVIIGKGSKLLKAVQAQFKNDFRPAIRTSVLDKNRGRLALSSKDVSYWLRTHKSLRGGNSIE